ALPICSTTTGSPLSGTVAVAALASRRELGATAPTSAGERMNCPMKSKASLGMGKKVAAAGPGRLLPGDDSRSIFRPMDVLRKADAVPARAGTRRGDLL